MLASVVVAHLALSYGALSPAVAQRRSREALLKRLPAGPPVVADQSLLSLVGELESHEAVPATQSFHAFSLSGQWELRALACTAADVSLAHDTAGKTDIRLGPVSQRIWQDGRVQSKAQFSVSDLAGNLQVDCTFTLLPTRSDVVVLRNTDCRLALPRLPDNLTVPELMKALHSILSAEFSLADGEYSLGLTTTYVDERLRITRYGGSRTKQNLAIYARCDPPDSIQ